MVERIRVDGFDPFMAEVVKHDGKAVFALFSGSVGADGRSWCSDCVSGLCSVVSSTSTSTSTQ